LTVNRRTCYTLKEGSTAMGTLADRTPAQIMTDAYINAMLFAETDTDGLPLDANYNASDLPPQTTAKCREDVATFLEFVRRDPVMLEDVEAEPERAGYDLWMTKNGHGVGFWDDARWPRSATPLTRLAQCLGQADVYVGDDDLIYILGAEGDAVTDETRGEDDRTETAFREYIESFPDGSEPDETSGEEDR
jgi:hypothetical protein